jgi:subtilisin family serine protease
MRVPPTRLTSVAAAALAVGLIACAPDGASFAPDGAASARSASRVASSVATPQYVVLGKKNTLPADLEASVAAAGGRVVTSLPQIGVAIVEGGTDFAAAASGLSWVESVAPDLVVDWLESPNVAGLEAAEADAGAESHTFNPSAESFYGFQWAPQAIGAPEAWAAGITGQGARVAILDGGIHGAHIDLRDRVDVARSASFHVGGAWNQDVGTFWHGTHVAGIVAASANGVGTIGIAPEATIIGVKVLHNGTGPFSGILSGIVYAATPIEEGGAGAHVINMSLGATVDEKLHSQKAAVRELKKAIDRATTYAYMRGVTTIVSAGNGATNFDVANTLLKLPAMNDHVISISATGPYAWARGGTEFSRPSYFTDHGKSLVTLGAPGGNAELAAIDGDFSTCTRTSGVTTITFACYVWDMVVAPSRGSAASITTYSWAQGTSMAAPAVSGIAALIIQRNGGPMHPSQVRTLLQQAALDLGGAGNDAMYGMGWVNAWNAVR